MVRRLNPRDDTKDHPLPGARFSVERVRKTLSCSEEDGVVVCSVASGEQEAGEERSSILKSLASLVDKTTYMEIAFLIC